MSDYKNILNSYPPISLEAMDAVKLLNRMDTKFLMSLEDFEMVLQDLQGEYFVLEIGGMRSARYQSLYFDTQKNKYYRQHHNGKPNRYKVRIRKYLDSDLCFFEIKHKKKGRTDKKRIRIPDFMEQIEGEPLTFLHNTIKSKPELQKTLWNEFERVTLVNHERKERLTFDIGLNFSWEGKSFGYDDVVIAELKQEFANRESPSSKTFKNLGIRPARISKYCIGMGLLYPELKTNRFKAKYLLIDKIRSNATRLYS